MTPSRKAMKDILKNCFSVKRIKIILVVYLAASVVQAQSLQSFDSYFAKSNIGKVQKKESENFIVSWVHPRDQILVDTLLQHMELAHQKLKAHFSQAMKPGKKIPIEIFPDLKTFSDVSQLSLSRFRATGTIALTLEQRLMLLSPRNLVSGYSWAETAVHEYIHYLIREISPMLIPIWLHEGTAQIFQAFPYKTNPELKPSQWGLFKRRRSSAQLLSLQTLQEPFPYRETPEEAELAYIQSFLFVRWLDEQCGIVNLLVSIEKLKSVDKGLEKCAGRSLAQIETDFIPKIMASIKVPEGEHVEWFARDFSGRDPLEVEGVKADRKAKNLAQLSAELFRQGRYRASGIEMKRALEQTPVAPPSWRRHLALSLQNSNQKSDAMAVLKQVLKDYPEDASAWYLLGMRYLEEKDWNAAWQAFLRAFYHNPFLDGLQQQMESLQEREPKFKDRFLLGDL